ncbi:MAG: Asp-tRNA(Asn)/Glu-tRNA(Gln) amidotransferase subunit GatA [Candidatus Firestonebacteria bacterium]|nr:Asp-tRNA(Asn)/Glu-tRNA(Gln) amidotransferase subunit GatA [Candidatus Firestonebacteria bacterium]
MNLNELTAHELHVLLKKKEITSVEITQKVLEKIYSNDKHIKAYITVLSDSALEKAKEVDRKISADEEISELAGIPIAIKDNMNIEGVRTTCGSKILYNFISPYDATVISKLKANDAIFIGKPNMDEFAMGSSTETSYYGITRNPWDMERIPGGSSGGSAASVASNEAILALGSDTGGSIRQPASLCGVVGMKPTYGLVSRFGLVAFASSLDQIGPITRDILDNARLLKVIAGYDKKDSTSARISVPDYEKYMDSSIKDLKIGIPKEYFAQGIDEEVKKCIFKALEVFKNNGALVKEISLPHTEYAVAVYYIIATAEASANLARYDGVRYGLRDKEAESLSEMYKKTRRSGFGPEVKRRIMLGTYVLSSGYYDAYYLKAQKVRTLIKQDFEEAFKNIDLILTPTSPTPAFKIGEKMKDPLQMYLSDIFTISANLAGIPGISIPCGKTSNGLPVGMQLLAKHFDEMTLLRAGYKYEESVK